MATTQSKQQFILRSRQLADQLIKVSDAFNALYAEATISQLFLPPENGGLADEDFLAQFQDITPDDIVQFYGVVGTILSPLTLEQKRVIYKVRSSTMGMPGMPMLPPIQ